MNLNQKLNQQTLAQIVGSLFILVSGILVLTKISGLTPAIDPIKSKWSFYDNWSSYFFLIGAFLYCSPRIIKKIKKVNKSTVTPVIVLFTLLLSAPSISAQDYTEQVDALAESFNSKSIKSVEEYLSADLQFGPIPASNSPTILTSMFSNFPPL